VLGIDAGESKKTFVESLGAQFLDFTKSTDLVSDVNRITQGGAHAVVVTSGHPMAFKHAADVLRVGGTLSMVGKCPQCIAVGSLEILMTP
jgi:alcohol dehydrogenase, propanol-preferring